MSLVWIQHADTGGQAEVPEDSVPIYRQSGWEVMPKKAVTDLEKATADELAAAEQSMRDAAAAGALTPDVAAADPAPAPEAPSKKENG